MGRIVIPPGRAGLIVLAVAAVPIVVKKFKPIVRWTGKKLSDAGARVTKMAEEVERYDAEKTASTSNAQPTAQRSTTSSTQAEAGTQEKRVRTKPRARKIGATPPANNPKTKSRRTRK